MKNHVNDNNERKIKPQWSIRDPIWLVRIYVSMQKNPNITDETLYFRCKMTYDFLCRWLWYFEFLQAKIKVANPKRVVSLYVGRMDPKILLGQDFIENRRVQLLRSRQRKLNELINTPFDDDLFGFTSQDVNDRIEKIKLEIEALERGEITFPILPDFVNEVKKWI